MSSKNPLTRIPSDDIEWQAIRASGAGGQNVNKVSTAIHLRYDIKTSSLSEFQKQRLLDSKDRRINNEGVFVLKAMRHRTQERNRKDALARLSDFIETSLKQAKRRIKTRPTRGAKKRRLDKKTKHGQKKAMRRQPIDY